MPLPSANKAAPLALKPRGDVTRIPKQEYQWPPQKGLMSSKIKKKQLYRQASNMLPFASEF